MYFIDLDIKSMASDTKQKDEFIFILPKKYKKTGALRFFMSRLTYFLAG
tara:strand:+ start:362 stop:508 length:147 start_codon:yes stop_codon:yes gene_type:complete